MDNEGNGHKEFVPDITAFTCIYCGYMSADTAGTLRITYPSNVKLVRLPCTGKVDVRYLLNAFEEGADGVYVVACPIGNCHHVHGNERAVKRVEYTRKLLDEVGIGGERLDIVFTTGGMGVTFADAARRMTERVKKLGPNPLKE
ncbi:MAG: hydrogenase iron-sulfur subunit [Anaerolineae bacterium]